MDQRAVPLFHLVSFPAVAPIEPSIGMEKRPVHIGSVAGEFEPADDHLALIRHAISVRIGQFPDPWRRRDIE